MKSTGIATVAALAVLGVNAQTDVGDAGDRHTSPELEGKDVIYLSGQQRHEDGLTGKDVYHLPANYCRLNDEGVFGSPTGEATELEYAFGVETPPGADFDSIFRAVGFSVEDILLAASFPELCSYRLDKRRQLNQIYPVHAYKFDNEMKPLSTKCEPLTHVDAKCNIYKGSVLVYGDTTFLQEVIDYHLSDEETADIHDDILRIFAVGQNGILYDKSGGGLKAGAVVGIVISMLALCVGVAGFIWFERKRREENRTKSFDDTFMNAEVNIAAGESHHRTQFTTINLNENESLVMEDGRPTAYVSNDESTVLSDKFTDEDVGLRGEDGNLL
eukprot:CAMPEP_0194028072 /NCGR_PEP_ID=MMETSP0009_2-20130614/2106_1 /TAXON_ID=210454 /ORGANISM="Grammatophora oceanica, Strain CCMP 410" /LENGTH=329 /DNA_ID=CAMNT_0038667337 /DNA_START=24 /DNA_END=1013 /DNA_ORIENTATION=-